MTTATQEQLQQRLAALSGEQAEVQRRAADWTARKADYEAQVKAALARIDLEGDPSGAIDAERYRGLAYDAGQRCEQLRLQLAEFPGRIKTVRGELDRLNHLENVRQFNALVSEEQNVYANYEAAALNLLTSIDALRRKQIERENAGATVEHFARANNLAFPTSHLPSYPTVDNHWNDLSIHPYIRQQFQRTREGLK